MMERVVFAADLEPCECCGEPWCATHEDHYGDCSCIGPTEDDVVYLVVKGVLFGTRVDRGTEGE